MRNTFNAARFDFDKEFISRPMHNNQLSNFQVILLRYALLFYPFDYFCSYSALQSFIEFDSPGLSLPALVILTLARSFLDP